MSALKTHRTYNLYCNTLYVLYNVHMYRYRSIISVYTLHSRFTHFVVIAALDLMCKSRARKIELLTHTMRVNCFWEKNYNRFADLFKNLPRFGSIQWNFISFFEICPKKIHNGSTIFFN